MHALRSRLSELALGQFAGTCTLTLVARCAVMNVLGRRVGGSNPTLARQQTLSRMLLRM